MASLSLAFDILARDKASKEFNTVGSSVDDLGKKGDGFGKKFGAAVAAGLAVAAAAAVKFASDSIAAYVDAEQASARLDEALRKFPATNDVTRESFDKLNSTLASKTKFDDDATASGQAVLAQFKLTGEQIQELTPLLQDYAAKTGKDLPTAAEDLGKAVLGQGRSLKQVGIEFKDTGTEAGNLDQITKGLREQVGGFAEAEGKTAAGQAEILRNQFGELQEKVGGALVPILLKLAEKVQGVIQGFKDGTGFGGQLRDAFDKIKQSVQDNEPKLRELGEALAKVGEFILTKVIPVVVDLAVTYVPQLVTAFEAIVSVAGVMAEAMLSAVGTFLGAIGSVFEVLAKVPGPFQDNFKAAAVAVGVAKASVDGLKVAVDLATKPKTLNVAANAKDALNDIDSVGRRAAALQDKTITITTIQRTVFEAQRDGRGGGLQARALGGPVNAGQPYLVGERGPELVVPNQNGNVLTASETRQALAGSSNADVVQAIEALRSDLRSLPRDYQLGMRQRAGV